MMKVILIDHQTGEEIDITAFIVPISVCGQERYKLRLPNWPSAYFVERDTPEDAVQAAIDYQQRWETFLTEKQSELEADADDTW